MGEYPFGGHKFLDGDISKKKKGNIEIYSQTSQEL